MTPTERDGTGGDTAMNTATTRPDSIEAIDAEYRDRVRNYRQHIEHIIANPEGYPDPVATVASLRVPRREDCVPQVGNLADARARVETWNTVSANPAGHAGLVAIIPDLAEHLGRYSEIANALHIGADTEGGMYDAANTMTHHLLMLAAIALEYVEGRLFPDAFNDTDEAEEPR